MRRPSRRCAAWRESSRGAATGGGTAGGCGGSRPGDARRPERRRRGGPALSRHRRGVAGSGIRAWISRSTCACPRSAAAFIHRTRDGASLLLEATAEPLLHASGEAVLVRLAPLGGGLLALRPDGGHGQHGPAKHHQEADDAEHGEAAGEPQRSDGDAQYEQHQAEHEDGDALQAPTAGRFAQAATANGGYELGVLGVESTLDLVEQSLLVLGEGHGLRLRHFTFLSVIFHGAGSDATSARGGRLPEGYESGGPATTRTRSVVTRTTSGERPISSAGRTKIACSGQPPRSGG